MPDSLHTLAPRCPEREPSTSSALLVPAQPVDATQALKSKNGHGADLPRFPILVESRCGAVALGRTYLLIVCAIDQDAADAGIAHLAEGDLLMSLAPTMAGDFGFLTFIQCGDRPAR